MIVDLQFRPMAQPSILIKVSQMESIGIDDGCPDHPSVTNTPHKIKHRFH